jgi:hypothetical protein
MSDNASEFRSGEFEAAVARLGARHIFIRAGRPQTVKDLTAGSCLRSEERGERELNGIPGTWHTCPVRSG